MGAKTKTVGGTKAGMGLSNDFVSMLSDLLNGGGIGTNGPAGANAVGGVRGVYGDILSQGAGKVGGALEQILGKQTERDVGALRSRFGASGGMAFGTPAAFAESTYRADAAPRATTAIGKLQLEALSPLLQSYLDVFNKNTPQAQTIQQKSTLGQIAGVAAPVIGSLIAPGIGTAVGSAVGQTIGGYGQPFGGIEAPETLPGGGAPNIPLRFGPIQ